MTSSHLSKEDKKLLRELQTEHLIETRRECCEILQSLGYRIKLNRKMEFVGQFEENKRYEVLTEEELADIIQEALEESGKDFIDDGSSSSSS